MAEGAEGIVTEKVGPLPLIVWVAGGAGVIFLFVMFAKANSSNTSQNVQTNQVSALAPTEAEAFGTIEQQQQDVTNALSTLGNNDSYLGGQLSTLTGIVTQQGTYASSQFQNLLNGQQTIEQGQASSDSANANYYNSLMAGMNNFFNTLSGQINGVNSNVSAQANMLANQNTQYYTNLMQAVQSGNTQSQSFYQNLSGMLSNLTGQVTQVSNQQQADATAQQWGFANTDALLAYMFYQIPNRYAAYFPASVNAAGNVSGAQGQVSGGGIGTAQPGWSTQPT